MDSRREFLKKASLLAGGLGVWNTLPASIQRAMAINPEAGTTFENAEHIVFLMQENRSFDHCFGTLQGVRGFNDPRAITLPGNIPVWLPANKKGQRFAPFRLNMKDTRATWMGGLPHSWTNQVDARNEGKYDQWLIAKQPGNKDYKDMPLTLGYYTRQDIPFYYALADAFTICDQNFCASLTGTTANRSFFWSGKIRENAGEQANVRNSDTYYNREAQWKTFPERLEENGIPWKVYQNEISLQTDLDGEDESWLGNFTDNNLEWFRNYNVRFHKAHYDFLIKRLAELPCEIEGLEETLKKAKKNKAVKINKTLQQKKQQLEKYRVETQTWNPDNFEKLTGFQKSLHQRAFTTNVNDPDYHTMETYTYEDNGTERNLKLPKGDVLHQFRQDVTTGELPTVSWLVAPQYFSDHPSAPWFGAWYVSEVLDILTQNPEVWKKTIFILNYDENDGYFDHLPPFTAPKPNDPNSGKVSAGLDTTEEYVTIKEEMSRPDMEAEEARESPVGLGYRVPLIIASPWSRGGWVNSEICDRTSTLRFLEKFLSKKTGKTLRETNLRDWRRTVSGDLVSAFRPYNGEKIDLPAWVKKEAFVRDIYNAKFKKAPSGYQALSAREIKEISQNALSTLLPGQEKGLRDSCALPYELAVDGQLTPDKKSFEIRFAANNTFFADRALGAPFNVYAPHKYAAANGSFEEVKAWSYAVKAGEAINNQWPLQNFENGHYHLRVYGANGFYREFAGSKNDPGIEITFEYESSKNQGKPTGNILLTFKNPNGENHSVQIEDKAYNQGIKTVHLDKHSLVTQEVFSFKNSFNWYDLSIKMEGNLSFEKRYAGRVETGEPSKTDPFMGRVVQ